MLENISKFISFNFYFIDILYCTIACHEIFHIYKPIMMKNTEKGNIKNQAESLHLGEVQRSPPGCKYLS